MSAELPIFKKVRESRLNTFNRQIVLGGLSGFSDDGKRHALIEKKQVVVDGELMQMKFECGDQYGIIFPYHCGLNAVLFSLIEYTKNHGLSNTGSFVYTTLLSILYGLFLMSFNSFRNSSIPALTAS